MPYSIDYHIVSLTDFKLTLKEEDPVPSRKLFTENINEHFNTLQSLGFETIGHLLPELKKKSTFNDLVDRSGINENYLVILSREIRSRIPRPEKLVDFMKSFKASH